MRGHILILAGKELNVSQINSGLFEAIEASPRADITNAIKSALGRERASTMWSSAHQALSTCLSERKSAIILTRIARISYMIEPVNSNITSTKFACRWSDNAPLYFTFGSAGDPRNATFLECDEIALHLLQQMMRSLNNVEHVATLNMSIDHGVISHELPIDYVDSHPGVRRIHQPGNVDWSWNGPAEATVRLRSWLLDQVGIMAPGLNATVSAVMLAAIKQKIGVKTYLTDRAQTGPYQTNREKRWESHPASVQFASRAAASAIERELLEQICFFEEFPAEARDEALIEGLIRYREVTRCPITLDPLKFSEFSTEVLTPSHGRSKFQVGHLNPLKTVGRTTDAAGHTAQNIAWISAAGNRIQGDLPLADARYLVQHISNNYRLLLPNY